MLLSNDTIESSMRLPAHSSRNPRYSHATNQESTDLLPDGWPLALIGDASGQKTGAPKDTNSIPGIFARLVGATFKACAAAWRACVGASHWRLLQLLCSHCFLMSFRPGGEWEA